MGREHPCERCFVVSGRGGRHHTGRHCHQSFRGVGLHGRLGPPFGEKAGLGQGQKEVRRMLLEQPGGRLTLGPRLSPSL